MAEKRGFAGLNENRSNGKSRRERNNDAFLEELEGYIEDGHTINQANFDKLTTRLGRGNFTEEQYGRAEAVMTASLEKIIESDKMTEAQLEALHTKLEGKKNIPEGYLSALSDAADGKAIASTVAETETQGPANDNEALPEELQAIVSKAEGKAIGSDDIETLLKATKEGDLTAGQQAQVTEALHNSLDHFADGKSAEQIASRLEQFEKVLEDRGVADAMPESYKERIADYKNDGKAEEFSPEIQDAVGSLALPSGIVLTDEVATDEALGAVADKGVTLATGASGPDVKELQQRLYDLGYGGELKPDGMKHIACDGDFGQCTENAVKAFQRDNDMEQTGVADPDLLAKMASKEVAEKAAENGVGGAENADRGSEQEPSYPVLSDEQREKRNESLASK